MIITFIIHNALDPTGGGWTLAVQVVHIIPGLKALNVTAWAGASNVSAGPGPVIALFTQGLKGRNILNMNSQRSPKSEDCPPVAAGNHNDIEMDSRAADNGPLADGSQRSRAK